MVDEREPVVLRNPVRCSIQFFNSFLPPSLLHYLLIGIVLGLSTGTTPFWLPIFLSATGQPMVPLRSLLHSLLPEEKDLRYHSRPAALGTCKDAIGPPRGSLPETLACLITAPYGTHVASAGS